MSYWCRERPYRWPDHMGRCSAMATPNIDVLFRVEAVERRIRWAICLGIAIAVFAGLATTTVGLVAQDSPNVRVRSLVVEDEQGRARIVLGAPLPADGRNTNLRSGIRINDPNGVERFGLTLFEDGRMVMGLDAPPGSGDDRNRERISLVADQEGGAYIRFLDRRTLIAGRLVLSPDNKLWLEFLDVTEKEIVRRRIGFTGEETVREVR